MCSISYRLAKGDRDLLVQRLMADRRLYAPVRRGGEVVFDAVRGAGEVLWEYTNTAKPPKALFFPPVERLMAYAASARDHNALREVPLDETPSAILGVRPCDLHALEVLDAVFLGGAYRDPYYAARREPTLLLALACARPRPTCFCHAVGGGPYAAHSADILMREAGEAYLLEGLSARGAAWLEAFAQEARLEGATEADLARAQEVEAQSMARLAEMAPLAEVAPRFEALFDERDLWREIADKCLACGTCTYLCPVCHCFNIVDRPLAGGGERVRTYDACMYATFTLHASGHNPRPDQAARWRQRVMHKFVYLPQNVGRYGCVGCGRCIVACPVSMDIRQVLERLRREVSQAEEQPHG